MKSPDVLLLVTLLPLVSGKTGADSADCAALRQACKQSSTQIIASAGSPLDTPLNLAQANNALNSGDERLIAAYASFR